MLDILCCPNCVIYHSNNYLKYMKLLINEIYVESVIYFISSIGSGEELFRMVFSQGELDSCCIRSRGMYYRLLISCEQYGSSCVVTAIVCYLGRPNTTSQPSSTFSSSQPVPFPASYFQITCPTCYRPNFFFPLLVDKSKVFQFIRQHYMLQIL